MPVDVMLVGLHAETLRTALAAEFPDARFHAAPDAAGMGAAAATAEVLICMSSAVTPALLRALPRLRFVQALTSGVDTLLDLPPGVALARVVGIHAPQMSELALLDMLLLARDYPRMLRNQDLHRWERWPQRLLAGRTAVILGVGRIAEALAPRCRAFDLRVVGVSNRADTPPGFDMMLPRARLAEAAALADFLVLLLPYEAASHHVVDAAVLAALRPTSYVINLARGLVLDELALAAALRAGRLAGAALDVFAEEPLPPDSVLWDTPNLVITPKIGGMSETYAAQALPTVRHNLAAWLAGGAGLLNRVERPGRG